MMRILPTPMFGSNRPSKIPSQQKLANVVSYKPVQSMLSGELARVFSDAQGQTRKAFGSLEPSVVVLHRAEDLTRLLTQLQKNSPEDAALLEDNLPLFNQAFQSEKSMVAIAFLPEGKQIKSMFLNEHVQQLEIRLEDDPFLPPEPFPWQLIHVPKNLIGQKQPPIYTDDATQQHHTYRMA